MAPLWRSIGRAVGRTFPVDLMVTAGVTLLTIGVVLLPGLQETPLRRVLGLPFLLFFPGYALVSLLFPEAGTGPGRHHSPVTSDPSGVAERSRRRETWWVDVFIPRDRGIDDIERVALAFALSVVVVPLLGLAISIAPVRFSVVTVLFTVATVTIVCTVGAAVRRQAITPEHRYKVPYDEWLANTRESIATDWLNAALNVLIVLSIVLTVTVMVGAVLFPPDGEQYTEFYLLSANESDDLTAAGYPQELSVGEPAELVIVVGNQEQQPSNYTVVVQLQRIATDSDGSKVTARDQLGRFETALESNETWTFSHEISPTMTGENLRLQYLLYRGEPPADPTSRSAYQDVYIWVDVTGSDTDN